MSSSTNKIDCSICKVKFDEDHGVWVCLECTEKLTNAIHQASLSPAPQPQLQSLPPKHDIIHSASSPLHRHPHQARRSSLPEKQSVSMTLFLELINNGNKRRFKYKPSDLHRNISLMELETHLLRRFSHDLEMKHLEIASQSAFEINDKRYPHEFIMFETLRDLFDGAKIKISINKYYFEKYKERKQPLPPPNTNKKSAPYLRRRSKSASGINMSDDSKLNIAGDVISPVFSPIKLRNNPYDIMRNDEAYDDANECIIIDNGSGLIKCGFGGLAENAAPHGPQIVFPSTYLKNEIGKKAIEMGQRLSLGVTRPIQRGLITKWNEMEYIWNDVLNNKLAALCGHRHQYNVSDHAVLMTERYETPYKDREKVAQIMFESFDVASLYLAHSACLCIYGTGKTKGAVLDIGDGITSVVAMFDSKVSLSPKVIEFGGCDLTRDIQREYKVSSFFDANQMKESHYSVPYDRSDLLFGDINKRIYELPDGKQIEFGKERMLKPLHFLFKSQGSDPGARAGINVSQLVRDCIKSNDCSIHNVLWRNIVLSGGTTMMNGFAEKFAKDIKHLTAVKTQVLAGKSRRFLAWSGAVVISSISTFKNISISRAMYREHGPSVVRKLKM